MTHASRERAVEILERHCGNSVSNLARVYVEHALGAVEQALVEASALREALDEIAHASWHSYQGDNPVDRIQGLARAALAATKEGRDEGWPPKM